MQCLQRVCPAAASLLLPARSPQTKSSGQPRLAAASLTLASPSQAHGRGLFLSLPGWLAGWVRPSPERYRPGWGLRACPEDPAPVWQALRPRLIFGLLNLYRVSAAPPHTHTHPEAPSPSDRTTLRSDWRFLVELGHSGCWVLSVIL